jgi:hypothetical protein
LFNDKLKKDKKYSIEREKKLKDGIKIKGTIWHCYKPDLAGQS